MLPACSRQVYTISSPCPTPTSEEATGVMMLPAPRSPSLLLPHLVYAEERPLQESLLLLPRRVEHDEHGEHEAHAAEQPRPPALAWHVEQRGCQLHGVGTWHGSIYPPSSAFRGEHALHSHAVATNPQRVGRGSLEVRAANTRGGSSLTTQASMRGRNGTASIWTGPKGVGARIATHEAVMYRSYLCVMGRLPVYLPRAA